MNRTVYFLSIVFTVFFCHVLNAQQVLFDGESLDGWYVPEIKGTGEVSVSDSCMILSAGAPITALTWQGDYPVSNYEITWEAKRLEGRDFFCTLTFPVGDTFCSLVIGGWGGSVLGLSNIDGYDAYNNFTGDSRPFKEDRWYSFRLRVTDKEILAWLGERDKIVDYKRKYYQLSVRYEVKPCIPLGFATYKTTGAIRNLKLTLVDE